MAALTAQEIELLRRGPYDEKGQPYKSGSVEMQRYTAAAEKSLLGHLGPYT